MKRISAASKKLEVILRILKFIRPYKWKFLIVLVLSGVGVLLSLIPTYMLRPLIDRVFTLNSPASVGERLSILNMLVLTLLAVHVMQVVFNSISDYQKAWLRHKLTLTIRNRLYEHLQKLSIKFYNFEKSGSIHSRVCIDTNEMNVFIARELIDMFTSVLMCISIGAVLFYLKWELALTLLIPIPVIVILSRLLGEKMLLLYRGLYQKVANMSSLIFRSIAGAIVVKTNVAEGRELNKFVKATQEIFKTQMQITKTDVTISPFKSLIIFLCGILIYWVGGKNVISGKLSLGELMVFVGYMWQFYAPISTIGEVYVQIPQAIASAERVFKILDTEPDVCDIQEAVHLSCIQGAIKFAGVSFSYDGKRDILKEISFEVKPGEIIGITGSSGAGKSTLVYLLCHLYNVSAGSIFVDCYDISKVSMKSLRNQIGIVLQDTMLFYDTIAENIAYAKSEYSLDDVVSAAKRAGAHDFIMRFPDAYDTIIGEGGAGLSGGERQRIAIARALLKNPKIIVLDEATSALDSETEIFIQATIKKLAGKHTIIIISHRLSMLDKVDRLFVLEEGAITELDFARRMNQLKSLISRFNV